MTYLGHILLAIDKLGNAISGGHHNNTISGRIGYYANHAMTITKWYWILLQYIVDFTFYPLDGPEHCHASYHEDSTKDDYLPTKWPIALFILSVLTVTSCVIIAPITWILYAIGIIKPEPREFEH